MTEQYTHADRELRLESGNATLTFTLNSNGLSLDVLEPSASGLIAPAHVHVDNLSRQCAQEIRDFLNYALATPPVDTIQDKEAP